MPSVKPYYITMICCDKRAQSKTLAWGALLAIESGSEEAIAQVKELQDAHGDAEKKAANEKCATP